MLLTLPPQHTSRTLQQDEGFEPLEEEQPALSLPVGGAGVQGRLVVEKWTRVLVRLETVTTTLTHLCHNCEWLILAQVVTS